VRAAPVAAPGEYHQWLSPHAKSLDVWTTEYLQLLPPRADREHPVVAWMRGSALTPLLAALPDSDRERFVADYAERIERAYARRRAGDVLFPFRRLFIVATR
jgi:trans-aconitate 2-methyltransferase